MNRGGILRIKSGLVMGLILMVSAVINISTAISWKTGYVTLNAFLFMLGLLQFIVSINCRTRAMKRFLLIILGVEGLYYIIAEMVLLAADSSWGVKLLGTIAAIIMLSIITMMISRIHKLDVT